MCKVIQCQECLPLLHILGQLQLSQPQNEETQQAAHVKRHRIVRSNCANNYIFTTYLTSSIILSQLWQHSTHVYIHSTLSPLAIEKPCSKIAYYTATNCNYAKHTYVRMYMHATMYKTMSQTMYKCYIMLGLHTLDQMITLLNAGTYTEHTRAQTRFCVYMDVIFKH